MAEPYDRLEVSIGKLTEVAADLKTLIAVHEVRITQQERSAVTMNELRKENDSQTKEIYETMQARDNEVLSAVNELRTNANTRFDHLGDKIGKMEKYIWIAVGGGIVATWIINEVLVYFQVFGHVTSQIIK